MARLPFSTSMSAQHHAPSRSLSTPQRGERAVDWLRLTTKTGSTGEIRQVYRVSTVGASLQRLASICQLHLRYSMQQYTGFGKTAAMWY
ncbi:hypothetical protein CDD81_653 [Ophiocordyceps australis]|uniref:Uncharacterized protein n=1 Tax=Ophiocordyceps australis TaxID=1399860 RepID=A0A2C5X8H2_9HYPO|nr:hypothetical protein CDD81_653 [Ophiocordyceps australis]